MVTDAGPVLSYNREDPPGRVENTFPPSRAYPDKVAVEYHFESNSTISLPMPSPTFM